MVWERTVMLCVLLTSFSLYEVTSGHRVPKAASLAGRVEDECDGIETVSRWELCILCFSSPCYFLPRAGVLKRIKS